MDTLTMTHEWPHFQDQPCHCQHWYFLPSSECFFLLIDNPYRFLSYLMCFDLKYRITSCKSISLRHRSMHGHFNLSPGCHSSQRRFCSWSLLQIKACCKMPPPNACTTCLWSHKEKYRAMAAGITRMLEYLESEVWSRGLRKVAIPESGAH